MSLSSEKPVSKFAFKFKLVLLQLGRVEDAERAYRVCVHDDANFTAWISLARIYVGFGWTEVGL